ncbi:unnamed protein product [Fusarium langsethiae]|nr:unnamed protein product [Fusarium langsethiae]
MFCPKCGASMGIDYEKKLPDKPLYGISVRQFNNIDLDSLRYKKFDGMHKMEPAVDLSGENIDSKTGEPPIPDSF